LVLGCDFPTILSEDSRRADRSLSEIGIADTLLNVEITGSIAGVQQQLVVDKSGLAIFSDGFRSNPRWTVQLSPAEVQELIALMLDNNFFALRGPYIDPRVSDAFFYEITFIYNQRRNTVVTDHFADPEPLKRIVEGVITLQKRIIENGLSLKLDVKPLANEHRQFDLTLTVANVSKDAIELRFNSSQIFDFYARRSSESFSSNSSAAWSWAHDKVFAQSIIYKNLAAGETLIYRVTWDGRDNAGNPLTGEVWLGATLKSTPGGSAEEQLVKL
jgi:hypothetical protein